jgi:MFS family permease
VRGNRLDPRRGVAAARPQPLRAQAQDGPERAIGSVSSAGVVATVVVVHPADAGPILRQPRDDAMVREQPDGVDRFVAEEGPYRSYERTLTEADGTITERISFRVAAPFWGLLFVPGFRRTLRRSTPSAPWWAPPERLDARATRVLGLLCSLMIVQGYLGTLMTQTATFAADEFEASTTAQSGALATTRAGVLIAVVILATADRVGRRRAVTLAAGVGTVLSAAGALAPDLAVLTGSQVLARGFSTALLLLIYIVSAEEMPAGSRAYAFSLLTMTAALGAGMCLWLIPVADLAEPAWRFLYVAPLLFLPLLRAVLRDLPETRRFASPHVEAPVAGHGRRFWLLASTGLLLAAFSSPASQLLNEFLRDERGYSAAKVALFTMVTVTPASIGVVAGGRLADMRGRRLVASVGIGLGVLLTVVQFAQAGWLMWVWAVGSNVPAGLAVPSYMVYKSELFPTSLRGRLGGVVEAFTVAGSAAGLLLVGALVDGGRSYGEAFGWLAIGPLVALVIVLVAFPETAHRSLEDINPEDAGAATAPPPRPPRRPAASTRGRHPRSSGT